MAATPPHSHTAPQGVGLAAGGYQTPNAGRPHDGALHCLPERPYADRVLEHLSRRTGYAPIAQEAKLSVASMVWHPGSAELRAGERALAHLAGWVDEHLNRFLPAPHGDLAQRFKPVGALSLALLALTSPSQHLSASPFSRWAERLAHDLAAPIARAASRLDWATLAQPGHLAPQAAVVLLAFPLLEQIGDVRFRFSGRIDALLDQPPADPALEWYLLRSLLYGDDHDAALLGRLAEQLDLIGGPQSCTPGALRDLARLVLFLTQFGRRPPETLGALQEPLCAVLPALTLWCMERSDFALGAELLLCQVYAGAAPHVPFGLAVSLLGGAIESDGAVAGYAPQLPATADRFGQCCDATLASLAALAEAQRVALELRYAELRAAAEASSTLLQARAVGETWS